MTSSPFSNSDQRTAAGSAEHDAAEVGHSELGQPQEFTTSARRRQRCSSLPPMVRGGREDQHGDPLGLGVAHGIVQLPAHGLHAA